jgi:hypothetical protein
MKTRIVVIASGLVMLASLAAVTAAAIPGKWEKVDSLVVGTGIIVKLEGGDRLEGEFLASDGLGVSIRTFDEEERKLPKSGIKKIQTIEKTGQNRIWDKALLGGAIGAGVTGLLIAGIDGDKSGAGLAVLLGAGIGAGIGAVVDSAVGARETLYVAP